MLTEKETDHIIEHQDPIMINPQITEMTGVSTHCTHGTHAQKRTAQPEEP